MCVLIQFRFLYETELLSGLVSFVRWLVFICELGRHFLWFEFLNMLYIQ